MVEWAAPVHRFVDERGTDCTAQKAYPACDAARTIYFRYAKSDDSLGRCRPIGIVRLILVVFPVVTFLAAHAGLVPCAPVSGAFRWLDSRSWRCRAVVGANDASPALGKPLRERVIVCCREPGRPRWGRSLGELLSELREERRVTVRGLF
ncbi:TPA: hypothetical protein QDC06_003684 [Burkholderia cepacia]|nr:hypothetical protein [Burkholderia cepacia]